MQNPLRRPKGNPPPPTDRDVERNKNGDSGYLPKDLRGHLVAMSGEFVGTFMFLYFAFTATQIASMSNIKGHNFSLSKTLGPSAIIERQSAKTLYTSLQAGDTDMRISIRHDRPQWTCYSRPTPLHQPCLWLFPRCYCLGFL